MTNDNRGGKISRRDWTRDVAAIGLGFFGGFGLSALLQEKEEGLMLKLPLYNNPTRLGFDSNVGVRSQLNMKFQPNYVPAIKSLYEKVEVEFEVAGKKFGATYKASDISPDINYAFALEPMAAPEHIPQKLYGIRKSGSKELIFQTPRPPRGNANGF
jgi:hypothetical protein